MKTTKDKKKGIDEYIKGFSEETQRLLQEVREIIKSTVPEAQETIKYGIPTFTLNGNLVHFGAFKNHIGFYPTSSGIAAFKEELSSYECTKGAIHFPKTKAMPTDLIKKIVLYRVKEVLDE